MPIDHLLALGVVQHFGDDVPGAAHIDSHQFLGIIGIHGNHGSAVDHHRCAAFGNSEEGFQRRRIGQITSEMRLCHRQSAYAVDK